jgi:hypothetical protein
VAFSTGVYEHLQFELLHLLSEPYKGRSSTLSIDIIFLNIGLFIEVSIFKSYFSQHHTPLDHLIFQERQYTSFLINIELGSLRFYVSFLHRGLMTVLLPLTVMLIQ